MRLCCSAGSELPAGERTCDEMATAGPPNDGPSLIRFPAPLRRPIPFNTRNLLAAGRSLFPDYALQLEQGTAGVLADSGIPVSQRYQVDRFLWLMAEPAELYDRRVQPPMER